MRNIDSEIQNTNLYVFEWAANNIEMDRADNMAKAMEYLSSNEYVFVGINGDTLDYMDRKRKRRVYHLALAAGNRYVAERLFGIAGRSREIHDNHHAESRRHVADIRLFKGQRKHKCG